ncbi:hypothetical protein SMD22_00640 (plasmid) [Brevibacillus halotolerans]|nr:hypothetical protein SMD22_00640 [Brevibacillus halotolerans]
MGSISRWRAITDFVKYFGERFNKHYTKLIGIQIAELKEVEVNYYVKGMVRLSDNSEYPVHYRWSDQEEDHEGKELDEEYTITEYYKDHLIDRSISSVRLGYTDRDDEVYILAFVEDNSDACLEIPVGFDPEMMEISGYAEELIGESEFQTFIDNR